MRSDPAWRFDEILDNRAAAFTLMHEPPAEEDYTLQPFNRRPDYGFAPLPVRACLIFTSRISKIRQRLALRYPSLRRAWKELSRTADD
jgi:hypothetical protein